MPVLFSAGLKFFRIKFNLRPTARRSEALEFSIGFRAKVARAQQKFDVH